MTDEPQDDSAIDTDAIGFSEVLRAELANVLARRKLVGTEHREIADLLERHARAAEAEEAARQPADDPSTLSRYGRARMKVLERLSRKSSKATQMLIQPSTKLGLNGLALSGGGVRSASFGLGVLQVLAERGLLRDVDYLSTVSGGGYIGSTLSTVLSSPDVKLGDNFPFRHKWGEQESGAFRHLRNCANFLHPGELLEKLRIPSLMFLGVFSNLVLILPYILFAASLTYLTHNYGGHDFWHDIHPKLDMEHSPEVAAGHVEEFKHSGYYTSIAWLAVVVGALLFPVTQRTRLWSLFAVIGRWLAKIARKLPWLNRRPPPAVEAPVSARSGLAGRSLYERLLGIFVLLACVVTFIEAQPYLISQLAKLEGSPGSPGYLGPAALAILAFTALLVLIVAGSISKVSGPTAGRVALVGFGLIGPILTWLFYAGVCAWGPFNRQRIQSWEATYGVEIKQFLLSVVGWFEANMEQDHLIEPVLFFLAGLLALVLGKLLIDVNATSLNSFYRDRLSRAYLFYVDREGKTVQDSTALGDDRALPAPDDLKLSQLNRSGTTAPYHLLNATLNVQRSRVRRARNRRRDFFLFSKEYVGGPLTGYCKTQDLEAFDGRLNVGTAMAISGAAASPSVASTQGGALVFFLALLNVRLGYWLVNPSEVRKHARSLWKPRVSSRVGPTFFFRELLGLLNEKSKNIYLSDGGHIENLGAVELLRRRCKRIIICDAESDPQLSFGALSRLIRYARVDLGCNIEIDLDALRLNEAGVSGGHCALGTVHYDNNETGELLYVKLSVTGDESETIREYRSANPRFPHESTTRQFFTEAQFEAYRHLGWHIARELLERSVGSRRVGSEVDNLDELFKGLRFALLPAAKHSDRDRELYRELSAIEARFSDQRLAGYSRELYPEVPLAGEDIDSEPDPEALRQVLHLCNQQLQLIERVFAVKQLGDPVRRRSRENQKWTALFKRWCQVPTFQFHWALHLGRLDAGFLRFCLEEFELGFEVGFSDAEGSTPGRRQTAVITVQGPKDPIHIPVGYLETEAEDEDEGGAANESPAAELVIDDRYFRTSLVRRFRDAARQSLGIKNLRASRAQLDLGCLSAPAPDTH